MQKYTTQKKVKKISTQKAMSIVLIIIGIILFILNGIPTFDSFQEIGDSIYPILFIIMGSVLLKSSSDKLNKIAEDYFEIEETKLTVFSNGNKYTIDKENPPKSLEQTLKLVQIETSNGQLIKIDLEDYLLEFTEKKELTTSINELKNNLK